MKCSLKTATYERIERFCDKFGLPYGESYAAFEQELIRRAKNIKRILKHK